MIYGRNVRRMVADGTWSMSDPKGVAAFKRHFRELLGVYVDENASATTGHAVLRIREAKDRQISPNEFSIRDLAYEFLGHEFVEGLHSGHGDPVIQFREAAGPLLPSAFQDINLWTGIVAGQVEARILDRYNMPEFIGRQLVETVPTIANQNKIIGYSRSPLPDEDTIPGEEFPNAEVKERYVWCPPTFKRGSKLSLAKETVIMNLHPEFMAAADEVGDALRYIEEYAIAATVMGVNLPANTPGFKQGFTANTFVYDDPSPNATPNATYQGTAGTGASAKYNYVNLVTGNTLVDWKSLNVIQQLFNKMRDWETNRPIAGHIKQLIVMPTNEWNARMIARATTVEQLTSGSSSIANAGQRTYAESPVPPLELFASPIWQQCLLDSGEDESDANTFWWASPSFKKAFVWREMWPLDVQQASPLSASLMERNIIHEWVCSWRGAPAVRDPHLTAQSTD